MRGGTFCAHNFFNVRTSLETVCSQCRTFGAEVLRSSDQLRQRMAWALSQVLVVGTGGFGYERDSELWINYYDILVRKASDE